MNANGGESDGSRTGRHIQLWAVFVGVTLLSGSAARAALDIPIGTSYNGTPPTSPAPWVEMNLVDLAPNTVRLTITAAQLSSISFIKNLFFNFDDTKNVTSLTFTPVWSLFSGVNSYSLTERKNNLTAASVGKFDIQLGFGGGNNAASQFNGGDRVVFDITSSQSFSAASFAFRSYQPGSIPPNSSWYAAAFIQNTGAKNNHTDWAGAGSFTLTSVPEPSFGFATAGCCLAGLGWAWLRKKVAAR